MKKHVIMMSKFFPKGHILEGDETDFRIKVETGTKLHTMRNGGKWPQRIKEVEEGKAILSVREWTGVPYNSPQKELFQITEHDGIGIEYCIRRSPGTFQIKKNKDDATGIIIEIIDGLAKNDGLSFIEFVSWFEKVSPGTELIIIHFTKFRYI